MIGANGASAVLSPILAPAAARVQADLGKMLQLRSRLLDAQRRAVTPEQAATVARLLADQAKLEAQAGPAFAAGQRLAAGSLDLNDALIAGQFYAAMEAHLAYADGVLADLPMPASVSVNWTKVIVIGGGAVAAVWAIRQGVNIVWLVLGAGGAWWLYQRQGGPR